MLDDLLTVKEVSDILDVSQQYVRTLIRSNKLLAQKIGRNWLIPQDSLNDYQSPNHIEAVDHRRRSKKKPTTKLLSFFTGAMGLDLGLERAGVTTIGNH